MSSTHQADQEFATHTDAEFLRDCWLKLGNPNDLSYFTEDNFVSMIRESQFTLALLPFPYDTESLRERIQYLRYGGGAATNTARCDWVRAWHRAEKRHRADINSRPVRIHASETFVDYHRRLAKSALVANAYVNDTSSASSLSGATTVFRECDMLDVDTGASSDSASLLDDDLMRARAQNEVLSLENDALKQQVTKLGSELTAARETISDLKLRQDGPERVSVSQSPLKMECLRRIYGELPGMSMNKLPVILSIAFVFFFGYEPRLGDLPPMPPTTAALMCDLAEIDRQRSLLVLQNLKTRVHIASDGAHRRKSGQHGVIITYWDHVTNKVVSKSMGTHMTRNGDSQTLADKDKELILSLGLTVEDVLTGCTDNAAGALSELNLLRDALGVVGTHCDLHVLNLAMNNAMRKAWGDDEGMHIRHPVQLAYKTWWLLNERWIQYKWWIASMNDNKPITKPQQPVSTRWYYTLQSLRWMKTHWKLIQTFAHFVHDEVLPTKDSHRAIWAETAGWMAHNGMNEDVHVIVDVATHLIDKEMLWSEQASEFGSGHKSHLMPRRVIERLRRTERVISNPESALQPETRKLLNKLENKQEYLDKVVVFATEVRDTFLKHHQCWLEFPLCTGLFFDEEVGPAFAQSYLSIVEPAAYPPFRFAAPAAPAAPVEPAAATATANTTATLAPAAKRATTRTKGKEPASTAVVDDTEPLPPSSSSHGKRKSAEPPAVEPVPPPPPSQHVPHGAATLGKEGEPLVDIARAIGSGHGIQGVTMGQGEGPIREWSQKWKLDDKNVRHDVRLLASNIVSAATFLRVLPALYKWLGVCIFSSASHNLAVESMFTLFNRYDADNLSSAARTETLQYVHKLKHARTLETQRQAKLNPDKKSHKWRTSTSTCLWTCREVLEYAQTVSVDELAAARKVTSGVHGTARNRTQGDAQFATDTLTTMLRERQAVRGTRETLQSRIDRGATDVDPNAVKVKRRQTCGHCGEFGQHNSRSCKNAANSRVGLCEDGSLRADLGVDAPGNVFDADDHVDGDDEVDDDQGVDVAVLGAGGAADTPPSPRVTRSRILAPVA